MFFFTVYCHLLFLWKSELGISCLLETKEKWSESNTFQSQINDVIFHIFIRFQVYSCKSDIVIFAWINSLKIKHSPFQDQKVASEKTLIFIGATAANKKTVNIVKLNII